MDSSFIYLDNHSTTQVDPEVLDTILPWFSGNFANASSPHAMGEMAEDAVQKAREQVALLINCSPDEIIFTSGATESNNLALFGIAEANAKKGNHIITTATEHSAVIEPCRQLERRGFDVTWLPVSESGLIDLNQFQDALRDETTLVSILHANNETGVIQDIESIGSICAEKGVLFHTDATQSVGKIPVHVDSMNVNALSCSAHKLYGPKGVGALYVRKRNPRVRMETQTFGGGQEKGRRSGTLNVPGIVGFGKAAEKCLQLRETESEKLRQLRDLFSEKLKQRIPDLEINGDPNKRLPHSLNIAVPQVQSATLMNYLPQIGMSSGAACSANNPEPSHVIQAMFCGRGAEEAEERARRSLRFALSRFTTEEELERAAKLIGDAVEQLRGLVN